MHKFVQHYKLKQPCVYTTFINILFCSGRMMYQKYGRTAYVLNGVSYLSIFHPRRKWYLLLNHSKRHNYMRVNISLTSLINAYLGISTIYSYCVNMNEIPLVNHWWPNTLIPKWKHKKNHRMNPYNLTYFEIDQPICLTYAHLYLFQHIQRRISALDSLLHLTTSRSY